MRGKELLVVGALYVLVLLTVLAALGRFTVPARERLPLRAWTLRDAWGNVRRGWTVLGDHARPLPGPQDGPGRSLRGLRGEPGGAAA
ncbi:hypothetical protein [Kocuria flava]|uniref:hypothetical protein n=1 Tax=Kocuria flava TaxID=446860 RepID=UPI00117C6E98|nr:hypothetical protein [Kocuria flava]